MYIAQNKSIKVPVSLYTRERRAEETALLDCGATECFVSPSLIERHHLPLKELSKPRKVRNVDGTTNRQGTVTQTAEIMIQYHDSVTCHNFLVADIGEDDIILGYPFFEAAEPRIDWPNGKLNGHVSLSCRKDWEQWAEGDEDTLFHARIAKATMAQQLAEKATDKKERTWQELVPKQYHPHGKVFSEQESE